jgi:hypothetical protein
MISLALLIKEVRAYEIRNLFLNVIILKESRSGCSGCSRKAKLSGDCEVIFQHFRCPSVFSEETYWNTFDSEAVLKPPTSGTLSATPQVGKILNLAFL